MAIAQDRPGLLVSGQHPRPPAAMAVLIVRVVWSRRQLDGPAGEAEAAAPYTIGVGDERKAGHRARVVAVERGGQGIA